MVELISTTMRSAMLGLRVLQECWRSAQRSLSSIFGTISSVMQEQRVWQECWRRAQRWRTMISAAIVTSEMTVGQGTFIADTGDVREHKATYLKTENCHSEGGRGHIESQVKWTTLTGIFDTIDDSSGLHA
jgi:hypothetical protein